MEGFGLERSVIEARNQESTWMDASRIDGCGPWKTLWVVGLPMITNGLSPTG